MKKTLFILFLIILCIPQIVVSQDWSVLNAKSKIFYELGKYDSARYYAEQALTKAEKRFKNSDPQMDTSIRRLALICKALKDYNASSAYFQELLYIRIYAIEDTLPDYASALYSSTQMFTAINERDKASDVYEKSAELVSGVRSVDYSLIYTMIMYYSDLFVPHDQDSIIAKTINNKKLKYGQTSEEYLTYIDSLSNAYKTYGKYRQAIPLFQESVDVRKRLNKNNTKEYAIAAGNLAYTNFLTIKYEKAMPLYEEAIRAYKAAKMEKTPEYCYSMFYYGSLFQMKGKSEKANEIYMEAEPIMRVVIGIKDPFYSVILTNLGMYCLMKKDYAKAEKYYLQDYTNKYDPKDTLGYSYMADLMGLSVIYERTNRMDKAEDAFVKTNTMTINQINGLFQYVTIAPEKKIAQYFNGFNYNLNSYYTFFFKRYKGNPTVSGQIYNDEIIKKGITLRALKMKITELLNTGDTTLIASFNRWIEVRQKLSKLYLLPISERKVDITLYEKEAKDLEDKMNTAMYMKTYQNKKSPLIVRWEDIRDNLKSGEAAIEFINFDLLNWYSDTWYDSTIYCALVVKPDSKYPELVFLFNEKDFDGFLKRNKRITNFEYVDQLYTYKNTRDSLYQYIWKPLDKYLGGVKKVFYSPSGLLHKISFCAIPIKDTVLLIDKYDLQLQSSTSNVALKKDPFHISKEYQMMLYGGILYDLDTMAIEKSAKKYRSDKDDIYLRDRSFRWSDSLRGATWIYLDGTLTEVNEIQKMFKGLQFNAKVVSGMDAVEESFKQHTTKSPEIIHIATHGFFFPIKKQKRKEGFVTMSDAATSSNSIDNSLLRSGLIFAGANYMWRGSPPVKGVDDGVLTAFEVSNLNLYNTKLVVMSACETGLGEIKGSEGVYGLQRGFKLAGVDYIIMSLWQIPDEQTVELMNYFYSNWLSGMDIREAFSRAQKTMRKKYDPFCWAAFVMVE